MAMNCVIIISNIINKLYNYYTLHTMTTDNQSVSQSVNVYKSYFNYRHLCCKYTVHKYKSRVQSTTSLSYVPECSDIEPEHSGKLPQHSDI